MSKKEAPSKVDDLTSAIREMASRVNSEFVPDENKTRNYIDAERDTPLHGRSFWTRRSRTAAARATSPALCRREPRNGELPERFIPPACQPFADLRRLAPQSHRAQSRSPEFAGQKLGRASITRRNVGSTCTAGNRIVETALAG
jgi:hypothetical protein